jgi:sigma-B regulation protein RsbU (phosphoserine phosphatase)
MSLAGRKILVADDQPDVREALRLLLKGAGCATDTADSPGAVFDALERSRFDLVVMDLNYTRDTTSGQEGLDALARLKRVPAAPPVVVMTAWGSMELAVEAVRRGAADFVMKPWDNDRLLATLTRRLEEWRPDRREEDLALAKRVQTRLMPTALPVVPGLEIAAFCEQARAVGGDFYDFIPLSNGHTLIVMGDVSGKGVAAALLMANLRGAFRGLREEFERDWLATLRQLNQDFHQVTLPEQYVVAFVGVWDPAASAVDYISAGVSPPLLLGGDQAKRLDSNAGPLGLMPEWEGQPSRVTLAFDDVVLLFSDGVDEFGEDRFLDAARRGGGLSARQLIAELAAMLAREGGEPADDLTLIALRRSAG